MDRNSYLIAFFSFCLLAFFAYLPTLPFLTLSKIAIAFMFLLIVAMMYNVKMASLSFFLIALFSWLESIVSGIVIIEVHMALLSLGMFFAHNDFYPNFVEKLKTWGGIFSSTLHGISLFLLILGITLVLSILATAFGLEPDLTLVYEKIVALPWYLLLFAVFFAPLSEEIFFRAFLARKYGILLSAAAFAASHIFYNSYLELVGTFAIGIVLAMYYLKYRNLLACVGAHFLYNLTSISIILTLSRMG